LIGGRCDTPKTGDCRIDAFGVEKADTWDVNKQADTINSESEFVL